MDLTAIQYLLGALSGGVVGFTLVPMAMCGIGGGVIGGMIGTRLSQKLAARKGLLNTLFALLIFVVAGYVIWRSVQAL